jgi:H2-forming N5,N10-methylenetetrahydromethanopterin dehydrogenase-like enzyme
VDLKLLKKMKLLKIKTRIKAFKKVSTKLIEEEKKSQKDIRRTTTIQAEIVKLAEEIEDVKFALNF